MTTESCARTGIASLTREQEFVLWSLRVDTSDDDHIRALVEKEVDWGAVMKIAAQQEVLPLVYRKSTSTTGLVVPPEAMSRLKSFYLANARKNLILVHEAIKVMDLLAEDGVEAILIKGPALAVQAYGDLALRQFCDIDILTRHPEGFLRLCNLLERAGCRSKWDLASVRCRDRTLIRYYENHFTMGRLNLDAKYVIDPPFFGPTVDNDLIWTSLRPASIGCKAIQVMSPEITLLTLCTHATKHQWDRLKMIADLVGLLSNSREMDWDAVLKIASEVHAKRQLFMGLLLAHRFGRITFPAYIDCLLARDRAAAALADEVERGLFMERESTYWPSVFIFRSRERLIDRMAYLLWFVRDKLFPTVDDFRIITLPGTLFFGYYLIRAFHLLIKCPRYLLAIGISRVWKKSIP